MKGLVVSVPICSLLWLRTFLDFLDELSSFLQLESLHHSPRNPNPRVDEMCAPFPEGRTEMPCDWRLFLLLPRLLLHRPPEATSTRTSWLNDLTILRLASRCSSCTQTGSAMRMLLWRCTGSGGGTLDRMRWKVELPVPFLWFKWVSCRQAARHCCARQMSNLSIPSVTRSGGHAQGGGVWSISRGFLSNWRSSSLW